MTLASESINCLSKCLPTPQDSKSRTKHSFEFDNCSCTVSHGDKAKTLILVISGLVHGRLHPRDHGTGPSRAGKTILMKMLTLEKVRNLDPRSDAAALTRLRNL